MRFFCAAVGVVAIALAGPLGRLFDVTPWLVTAVGGGTVTWAVVLALLVRRDDLRPVVRVVAVANTIASLAIGALAALASELGAGLILACLAIAVAAFAIVQLGLLRRTTPRREGAMAE